MKKGDICEGIVNSVAFPNKGRVLVGDRTVFVKNTIPGQRIRFRIHKKKGTRVEGTLMEVLKASPMEICSPACSLFQNCGGCLYQTMFYGAQLQMKTEQVRELLAPLTEQYVSWRDLFEGIFSGPDRFRYRNKMEYSFGDSEKGGPLTLGLHKKNSTYDVLSAEDCALVHEDFNRILRAVLAFFSGTDLPYYHKMSHEGYLRHLLVRRAAATGEILVDLVTSTQIPSGHTALSLNELLESFKEHLCSLQLEGELVGVLHTENDALSDMIRNDRTEILSGRDYFHEEILGMRFNISPFSFFQTNSGGAAVLYDKVRSYLGDVKGKNVFDLYSGTGTIAQILAPVADHVTGVEIVEEAVAAARENAALNGLSNCSFLAGDVLKVIDELQDKPDVIVLDPPRDGIHPKALPKILSYQVPKIVYVSCKVSSLARDLEQFHAAGYRCEKICCVDMFPMTQHVETVVLMSRKDT